MKTYIGLLGLILLATNCDIAGTYELATLSDSQRSVINEAFQEEIRGAIASGVAIEITRDDVPAGGQERLGDRVQIKFGGFLSLASSPDVVVPSITVSRQKNPSGPEYGAGSISEEKYLLTSFDLLSDDKSLGSLVFTRINRRDERVTRTLRLRAVKNDWIEDVQLDKGIGNRAAADIYIDKQSAAKVGNLFAELQTRLEEMK